MDTGLLEAEARLLNEAWFHYVKTGLPWVVAKAACSLDGKIATGAKASGSRVRPPGLWDTACGNGWTPSWSGSARCWPMTPSSPPGGPGARRRTRPHPGRPRQPPAPAPGFPDAAPELRRPHLGGHHQPGAEGCDPRPGGARGSGPGVARRRRPGVRLAALLEELGTRQVQSLLVEGGAETWGSLLDQRLVNQVRSFNCPKIRGGDKGPGDGGRSRGH